MPTIGITGGVSTGKSTFSECLREILPAAKFFDADAAAHQLVDLEEVKQELLHEFGLGIFARNGDLNRAALRAIIFRDAAKKSALEQILHPRIRRQWVAQLSKLPSSQEQVGNLLHGTDFFFADIPLLYETGGETLCDRVVVVACTPDVQLSRLLGRGSINRAIAQEIINSQMPLTEKISRADHVVWNDGDRAVLKEQAALLVKLWQSK